MIEKIDHKKYPTRLPVIKTYAGELHKFRETEIIDLENGLAAGKSLGGIAIELGLCERDFKSACRANIRLQDAIKRGRTRDEDEYRMNIREAAMTCANPTLAIWHGKISYGMSEKSEVNHTGGSVIVVNTGIQQAQVVDKPLDYIEHNAT